MKWTLDVERKEIELDIQDEVLGIYLESLRTERCRDSIAKVTEY